MDYGVCGSALSSLSEVWGGAAAEIEYSPPSLSFPGAPHP